MKYKGFMFTKDWAWFYVFPAIVIIINKQIHYANSLQIRFHWLGWHLTCQWIEEYTSKKGVFVLDSIKTKLFEGMQPIQKDER